MQILAQALLELLGAELTQPSYWKDSQGHYLGGNEAFLKLTGFDHIDELIGKTDFELPWREFANEIRNKDQTVIKTAQILKCEEKIINAHGEIINASCKKIPITDHENHICGLVSLLETETNLDIQHVLENSPSNIYWKDLKGRYLGVNKAAAHLIYSAYGQRCEIIGKTDYDFYEKDVADRLRENDEQVIQSQQPASFEEWLILKDGSKRTYASNKIPLRDKSGKIIGVLGSSVNISQQKNLEVDLISSKKAAEIYLQSIVSNLPDHVFWEDTKGIFLGCNDQQAKSFGYESSAEIIGKNVVDLFKHLGLSDKKIEELRANDQKVLTSGQTIVAEEQVLFADGALRTFHSKKAPLKDENGKIIGMLGLAFDITERKEMENNLRIAKEKAEEANIAKSDFIANISHDLRTPLHAMLGAAELIQVNPNDEHRDEMVNTILNAGKNLLKLIENVLSYSEFESSHKVSFNDSFDLRDLIESIVAEHTHAAEAKKIALIVSYSDFVPHYVISHLQNIRRIVGNLLENAIKFTEQGHVLIAVECLSIEEDRAELQIIVEDTGIGISKHDVEHIFDRFYRASPAHVNKYKGSGLGLAIIKQLTESMSGSIKVNSQLGYGTTFCCTIPFKLTEKLTHADDLKNQLDRARVLVIDDHKQRRQTLLKQFPSQNITAVNSRSAIATFNASEKIGECFNLIIIDEELETGTPEQLALALRDHSSLPLKPLLVLCRKINGSTATDEQRKLFKVILKKPLAPSEIASHIAPEWQTWYSAYQRKSHKTPDKKVHVLLVEDDPLIQKFTANLLRDSGCEVELAATGRGAIEKASADYDLILMDIGLPDIDGLTVTEEIRSLVKDRNKQPIIVALTAHVSNKDREHCLKSGLDDFLKKPASYHDFQELLRKYF